MGFRKLRLPAIDREYFMSLLSGFEAGLATTAAIAAGLVISFNDVSVVILTATISYIIQAFNNAVGRFSADRTSDELSLEDALVGYRKPVINAALQFMAHLAMGMAVLLPLVYISGAALALAASLGLTLALLFLLGLYKGLALGKRPLGEAAMQTALGALVIAAGIGAGWLLS